MAKERNPYPGVYNKRGYCEARWKEGQGTNRAKSFREHPFTLEGRQAVYAIRERLIADWKKREAIIKEFGDDDEVSSSQTFAEACVSYLEERPMADSSKEDITNRLGFWLPHFKDRLLETIRPRHIKEELQGSVFLSGKANSYIRDIISAGGSVFRHAKLNQRYEGPIPTEGMMQQYALSEERLLEPFDDVERDLIMTRLKEMASQPQHIRARPRGAKLPDPPAKCVAGRVAEIRKQQGLKRLPLVMSAGIALETMRRIEQGEQARTSKIKAVADALGVGLLDLGTTTVVDHQKSYKRRPVGLQFYLFYVLRFYCGLRPGEAIAVRWGDYRQGYLHIRRQRSGKKYTLPKNRKQRVVYVCDFAREALQLCYDIQTESGKRIPIDHAAQCIVQHDELPYTTYTSFATRFSKVSDDLGIPHRSPYNCRQTCASMMLTAGMESAYCAKQLGHSVQMFEKIYAQWLGGEANRTQEAKWDNWSEEKVAKRSPNVIETKKFL